MDMLLPYYEDTRFRVWLYILILSVLMLTCSSQALVYYTVHKALHKGKKHEYFINSP
jgi:hypothetical protein